MIVETQSGGVGGIAGSHAEGRYTSGDQSFSLSVTDMAAAGALASLGGAMNMQSSKQTATGYEEDRDGRRRDGHREVEYRIEERQLRHDGRRAASWSPPTARPRPSTR